MARRPFNSPSTPIRRWVEDRPPCSPAPPMEECPWPACSCPPDCSWAGSDGDSENAMRCSSPWRWPSASPEPSRSRVAEDLRNSLRPPARTPSRSQAWARTVTSLIRKTSRLRSPSNQAIDLGTEGYINAECSRRYMNYIRNLAANRSRRATRQLRTCATLCIMAGLMLIAAGAQARESAERGGTYFWVGGGASAYYMQYGGGKNLGITGYIDADSIRRFGFEA